MKKLVLERVVVGKLHSLHIQDLFKLLAGVVLADRPIVPERVDVFSKEMLILCRFYKPELFVTRTFGTEWFMSNKDNLISRINSPTREMYLEELVRAVYPFSGKERIYNSMLRIAHSNNGYQSSANELIKIAAYRWRIEKL